MKKCKLNEVASLIAGFPFDGHKYSSEGIRVVRGDNVTIGNLRWDIDKRWNYPFKEAQTYSLRNEDIVIGMDGSRVGRNRAIVSESDLPLYLAQRVACVRHNEKSIQKYLYYAIFSDRFEQYIKTIHTGTSIPHISLEQLGDFEFILPSISEQEKIGNLLFDIDQKISLNTRMNAELEAMAKQLYDYWFVQFDFPDENGKPYKSSGGKMVWNEKLKRDIPEGWEVVELRSILDNMVQGTLPGNHLRDLPYCPIDEIPIRRMSFAGGKSWEEAQSSLQLYEKKNILIGAMRVYFHRCCISSCPGITRTTTIVLTPRKEEYLSYCYQVCNEERTFEFAIKESNGTQQPYVTWNSLSKFILPYPKDDRIIKQYCEQTSMIVDLVLSNEIQCDRLTLLRDSLLPMLMNGQVTIE